MSGDSNCLNKIYNSLRKNVDHIVRYPVFCIMNNYKSKIFSKSSIHLGFLGWFCQKGSWLR